MFVLGRSHHSTMGAGGRADAVISNVLRVQQLSSVGWRVAGSGVDSSSRSL